MSFAFAGTPEFAAWVLQDLADRGRRPSLVITQPDRPCGRGRRTSPPPVAIEAARLGIDPVQTGDINSPSLLEQLQAASVSTLVVAAFGQLLGRTLLDSLLCLNIHASLLPVYRGAAPIERALAAGDECLGITVMRITERLDEGPMALQKALSVDLHDDAGSVARVLALLGAVGIDQVLTGIADGTVTWTEQSGPSVYAEKLCARDCALQTACGAKAVHDQVRSLSPSLGARASSGGLDLKIWRTWPYGEPGLDPVPHCAQQVAGLSGRLLAREGRLFVGCGSGVVEILVLQPAGKARMTAAAFLRGYSERLRDRLVPAGDGTCEACEE
ncbi:MAG: methionyl-tRNA formyltransferase [Thermoleophilia bacterium]|nr:methionyl-tRNA formyltransferase [Thermoleophilia bacterium]